MDTYICPNDRQLALRARLGTGWSSRAQSVQTRSGARLSTDEEEQILQVLKRNEVLLESEKQRIETANAKSVNLGRIHSGYKQGGANSGMDKSHTPAPSHMLQRLELLKSDSASRSRGECAFCKQEFGLLHNLPSVCSDCGRQVCTACSYTVAIREAPKPPPPSSPSTSSTTTNGNGNGTSTPGPKSASQWTPVVQDSMSLTTTPVHQGMSGYTRSRALSEQGNEQKSSESRDTTPVRGFGHMAQKGQYLLKRFRFQKGRRRRGEEMTYTTVCKICHEAREVWKRSGAWFYKTLPRGRLTSCPNSPSMGQESRVITNPTELVEPVSAIHEPESSWVPLQPRRRFSQLDGCEADEKAISQTEQSEERSLSGGPTSPNEASSSITKTARTNNTTPPSRDPLVGLSALTSPKRSPLNPPMDTQRRVIGSEHPSNKYAQSSQSSTEGPARSPPNHTVVTSMPYHPAFANQKAPSTSTVNVLSSSIGMLNASKKVASLTGEQTVPVVITPSTGPNMGRRGTRTSCDEAPFGLLYFTLYHDTINKQLHVAIHKAKNLIAMDANGLSDPYVVCQILPSSHNSPRPRTSTRPQCLNPVWNEALTFEPFEEKNMQLKTLRFAVLDEDVFGSDWLGEYWLSLSRLTSDRLTDFAVPLGPKKPLQKGEPDLACPTRGKIQLGLRYFEEKHQLCVDVIRCSDLASMDPNGLSDPFVKLYLRPDKTKKTKQKTLVKKATLFPEFHEQFNYEMHSAEAGSRTLEVTVWDFDRGPSNDFIGGLTLGAGAKAERRELWLAVFRPPYRRIEAWFQLSSRNEQTVPQNSTPGICD